MLAKGARVRICESGLKSCGEGLHSDSRVLPSLDVAKAAARDSGGAARIAEHQESAFGKILPVLCRRSVPQRS
jgi:hypothetical protein